MSAAVPASPATTGEKVLSWFPIHEFFTLDLRSLALFRIGLGVMLLQEWLNRLVDLRAHYSDAGMLPRDAISGNMPISIFLLGGSEWFAGALMLVGCVFALLMLVGWRTQFVTFISWFLIIGVHGRNFAIMQGGDVVMRMLLFWSMFLPLGACYSLDALREPLREWRPRLLSPGSAAYVVQVALLYLFAAAWKTDPAWREDFTAVYLALSLDGFATSLGHWLLNFPKSLKVLAAATMALEIFGPLLLFMPYPYATFRPRLLLVCIPLGLWLACLRFPEITANVLGPNAAPVVCWPLNLPIFAHFGGHLVHVLGFAACWVLALPFSNAQLRVFTIASFIGFHAGLGLTLELGNFPWICSLAWVALLPTASWEWLEDRLYSLKRAGLAIYYDADNAWHVRCVEAARLFLLLYETKALPAQGDEQRLARVRAAGPWLVVDAEGREHAGYEGLLRMVQVSLLYWPLAYLLKWRPIRGIGEWWVRRLAARPAAPPAEPAPTFPGASLGGWIQNSIVIFFLGYLIAWNLRTLDSSNQETEFKKYFPHQMNSLAYALGLDQSWGLFAPAPGRVDGWYIIPARLTNGKVIDLYRDGAELTTAKPPLVSATYTNTRTRKHLMNLVMPDLAPSRSGYARYLIQEWNRSHGPEEQVEYLEIIYMLKLTEPDRQVDKVDPMRLLYYPPYPSASIGSVCGLSVHPAVYAIAGAHTRQGWTSQFPEIERARRER